MPFYLKKEWKVSRAAWELQRGKPDCCALQIKNLISDFPIAASQLFKIIIIIWSQICCLQQKIFLAGGKAGWFTQEVEGRSSVILQAAVVLRKRAVKVKCNTSVSGGICNELTTHR